MARSLKGQQYATLLTYNWRRRNGRSGRQHAISHTWPRTSYHTGAEACWIPISPTPTPLN